MRKTVPWLILALTLTACAEYQGRQTNCWSQNPAMSFIADNSGGACDFVPLD